MILHHICYTYCEHVKSHMLHTLSTCQITYVTMNTLYHVKHTKLTLYTTPMDGCMYNLTKNDGKLLQMCFWFSWQKKFVHSRYHICYTLETIYMYRIVYLMVVQLCKCLYLEVLLWNMTFLFWCRNAWFNRYPTVIVWHHHICYAWDEI